jgi:hypothetical protein
MARYASVLMAGEIGFIGLDSTLCEKGGVQVLESYSDFVSDKFRKISDPPPSVTNL